MVLCRNKSEESELSSGKNKVSIVIPARNEQDNLPRLLPSIIEAFSDLEYEIIVVDDNSADKTGAIALDYAHRYESINVVRRRDNLPGFGRTVRLGFDHATGDTIVVIMGDFSDSPWDAVSLAKTIDRGHDLAIGSRYTTGGQVKNMSWLKYILSHFATLLVRFLFRIYVKDATNNFRAYRANMLRKLRMVSDGYELGFEILLKAALERFKIVEVPVTWQGRRSEDKARLFKRGFGYARVLLQAFAQKGKRGLMVANSGRMQMAKVVMLGKVAQDWRLRLNWVRVQKLLS